MDPLIPPPEITVLLLGDSEIGKSTFLSRLSLGIKPHGDESLPPYALPKLRDLDQPFTFNISLYARPYKLSFYDTASPENYTLLRPDFIILCYDVSKRSTLESVQTKWITVVNTHYNYGENLPVMLLGLKRDARREWTAEEKEGAALGGGAGGGVGNIQEGPAQRKGKGQSVMPQEGLNAAQELLCDRYAECSALTGELCREVLEDMAKLSARTTTEKGAKTEGGCAVM